MISVVIPVYNEERFLGDALESVRAQTHPPDEVIVIDDGSTDATGRIVQERFPEVRYERQANAGQAAARNRGVERARGEWIAFLDADDIWHRDKLAVQCEEIARHPEVGLVYSDLDRIDAGGAVVESAVLSRASRAPLRKRRSDPSFLAFDARPFPYPSTVVVRRQTLLGAGGFNPAFRYHEDLEAFARVFRMVPVRFIARSLVGYRIPGQLDATASRIRYASWVLALNSLWELWSDQPDRQALLVTEFARHYAHQGKRYLRGRDLSNARRSLRIALAYRPLLPKAWTRLLLSYLPGARDLYARRKSRGHP